LTSLLAVMIAAFLVVPFFLEHEGLRIFLRLAIELMLIGLVLRLNVGRAVVAFVIGIAVLDAIADWTATLHSTPALTLARLALALGFLGTVAVLIGSTVWRQRDVTADSLLAVIAVYMLLGLCWSYAFSMVEFVQPGSFENACEARLGEVGCTAELGDFPRLIYFSFVTLTTLGYGDIVPTTRAAEGIALMASISGQLFLAILIGRIVGMYIARQHSERS
jgi:hypothetical protein